MEELYARNGDPTNSRSLSLKLVSKQATKEMNYPTASHGVSKAEEDTKTFLGEIRGMDPRAIETEEDFSRMVPAEHLDEAKRALADGYKLDANPIKTMWGRVRDAKKHLKEIQPDSPQYKAAQSLLRQTLLRERRMEHICVNVANQIMVKQREMLVNELEQYYANRGLFIDVELSGPDKTSMKLVCPLFRETSVDRIADETSFFTQLKKAGFTKVMMSDDDENVWTYRLEKLP